MKVTLLGTGSPPPVMHRFGPSTLVEGGGQTLLFDAGRGAMQRLEEIGTRWSTVDGVFLTHLHSDHVVGFPDVWLTGWLMSDRRAAVQLRGPRGTTGFATHVTRAFEYDLAIRARADGLAAEGATIVAEDVADGVVFRRGGVTVTAFEVDHRPVDAALGYRIDYGGRTVVLSGDTRPCDNLIRHARNADVLVLNVASGASLRRAGMTDDAVMRIVANHTTPEEAAALFARVRPRLAVYSHIVSARTATEDDLLPPTRAFYSGAVEVGEDLMVIRVGATITVDRPTRRPSEV